MKEKNGMENRGSTYYKTEVLSKEEIIKQFFEVVLELQEEDNE